MPDKRGRPTGRREPRLDDPRPEPGELDIRLSADDRPGGAARARRSGRREPTFDPGLSLADEPLAETRRSRRSQPPVEDEEETEVEEAPRKARGRRAREPEKPRLKRPRRSIVGRAFYWGVVGSIWAVIGLVVLVAYHASRLPPIDQLAVPKRPPNIAILAMDGTLVANRGETGGRAVQLQELPPYLPKAFIAIEDRRFYQHWGIDPVGIARALVRNVLRSGGPVQGGSTLTQQLAKNLFLTQERTASRKIQEAILALWLERNFSKDQILELYLNRVYFGSGAYGVEAAALKYFGKPARSVTLAEAATLAGLVQAPSRLAPNRNPDAAQARASLVVAAMAKEGMISDKMAKIALTVPAQPMPAGQASAANYAADYVMDVLDDFIGTIDKDLIVTTTLDSGMEQAAERALVEELAARGDKFGVSQGAFVAMQPDGAIRAIVGGRNYSESQYNRATIAKRQPGSAFKPFVYLSAVEKGLTPDTVRDDAPISVKGWQPENYSRNYMGPVTLRTALSHSLNTVAVRLALEVGPKTVVKTAARMGIQSKLEPNASIALGTSEVTPLELVSAYAPFANGGIGVMPFVIVQVKTKDGEVVYQRNGGGLGRVLDPAVVGAMNTMMRETLLTGTAKKADLPGWEAAGKTGTSQDFRDAWFVGYTGTLVAGVWLGNDDSSPTKKASGSNLPVEIWSRFMKQALAPMPPVPLPGAPWRRVPPAPGDEPVDGPVASGPEGVVTGALPGPSRSPLVINPSLQAQIQGQQAPAPGQPPRPVADNGLRPPADVPGGAGRAPGPRPEKNFFEKLFGG
jgi:penicillin-binding protein 1A